MNDYTRRQFLAAGAVGTALVAGCFSNDPNADGDSTGNGGSGGSDGHKSNGETDEPLWTYDTGASLSTVDSDLLLGREEWTDGSGGVLALDPNSGDKLWTFGETGGYSSYSQPVVGEAIYTAFRDDAIGSGSGGLYALDRDGTVRWEQDTGSVYHTPLVADGRVYVAGDDGVVATFDAVDGDTHWTIEPDANDSPHPDLTIEAVAAGSVYITGHQRLRVLDADNGDRVWDYESPTGRMGSVVVTDRAYCGLRERIVAIEDGEQRWSTDLDGYVRLRGVTDDAVYVQLPDRIYALDPADGSRRWHQPVAGNSSVRIANQSVYTGGEELSAYAADGELRWSISLDGHEVKRLSVSGDVYATTETGIYRVADGEIVSAVSLEDVRSLVVGEDVYVGTRERVTAFDL